MCTEPTLLEILNELSARNDTLKPKEFIESVECAQYITVIQLITQLRLLGMDKAASATDAKKVLRRIVRTAQILEEQIDEILQRPQQ